MRAAAKDKNHDGRAAGPSLAVHAFYGAIALSMPLFRRQAAALRFWLWFAASTKFLFPFALLTIWAAISFRWPGHAAGLAMIRPATVPFAVFAAPLAAPAPPVSLPAMSCWCYGPRAFRHALPACHAGWICARILKTPARWR